MTVPDRRKLPDLSERINSTHGEVVRALHHAVDRAIAAGTMLIEAKQIVGHGNWADWLEQNCSFSPRTAQGYMRLAREVPKLPPEKAQRVADLSLRDAIRAVATDTQHVAKLPPPSAERVLDLSDSEPLRPALMREINHQRYVERQTEAPPPDSSSPLLAPPPRSLEPPRADPAFLTLAADLLDACRRHRSRPAALSPQMILEALNAVYCAIQENGEVPAEFTALEKECFAFIRARMAERTAQLEAIVTHPRGSLALELRQS